MFPRLQQFCVGATAVLLVACGGPAPPSVLPPANAQLSLSLAPTSITLGQSAELNWTASNATACTASGAWSGARPLSGRETVTPTAAGSPNYVLRCTGSGTNVEQTVTLTVQTATTPADVVLNFDASPRALELGNPVRLTWTAANATSCTASGAWSGTKAVSGDESLSPTMLGNVLYRLHCVGAANPDTKEITVVVADPFTTAFAEFLRLRALENTP